MPPSILALGVICAAAVSCPAEEHRALLDALRAQPADAALLDRASDWAARQDGIAALAERVERAARQEDDAVDLHIAAELWMRAGQRSRAFGAFESAVALEESLPESWHAFIRLHLEGGWPEEASALWERAPKEQLSFEDSAEIRYKLAAAEERQREALEILDDERVPPARRLRWAVEAERPADAARIARRLGDLSRALDYDLAAGRWQVASSLAATHSLDLRDDQALALARASGDSALLERHLGSRHDPRAGELRRALARSLGVEQAAPETMHGEAYESAGATAEAEFGPREAAANALLAAGGAGTPEAKAAEKVLLDESYAAPSLLAVLAFDAIGAERPARRELTRWNLEPRIEERERFGARLRRQAPELLVHSRAWIDGDDPRSALAKAAPRGDLSPDLHDRLERALARAEPGSDAEAVLLYYRGLATGAARDFERAVAIAPRAEVTEMHGRLRRTMPIDEAWAWRQGVFLAGTEPAEPDPVDAPIGVCSGRILRLSSGPLPDLASAELRAWCDDPDPPPGEVPGMLPWDESGARLPGGASWRAHRIAPLHSQIRVPSIGWVFLGSGGLALLAGADAPGERLRLEAPGEWNPTALAEADLAQLPAPIAGFLRRLQPPEPPAAARVSDFLDAARRRQRDPGLALASVLAAPSSQIIVRTSGGQRAVLGERDIGAEESPHARTAPAMEWRSPSRRRAEPTAAGGAHGALVRRWVEDAEIFHRSRPWILPAPSTLRSDRADPLVGEGSDGRHYVAVTTSGTVIFCAHSEARPRWVGRIEPPLPGVGGFPLDPVRPAGAPRERGPHRAGPVWDVRTPGIVFGDGCFFVVTDRVVRFAFDGRSEPTPLAAPCEEILDLAVSRGRAWVLPGLEQRLIGEQEVLPLPRRGGFDLEAVGERLFLLGFDAGAFWLAAIDLAALTLEELPLPPLEADEDRERLRFTTLGRWGDALLLLHDRLYSADMPHAALEWRVLAAWPIAPELFPSYLQAPPRVEGDTLIVSRPWGTIEGWGAAP